MADKKEKSQGGHFVVIRVPNPIADADFFSRIFDTAAVSIDSTTRQINTGRFLLRILAATAGDPATRGLHFEINVDNVNQFAEDVWNRGVKYASRPQNSPDGLRRVAFVSPSDIKVIGVGPPKLDSTGAFPAFPTKK
ncbi:MAG: hypothetical protein IT462_14780 [Planctomycetes bacterium]|nr:hypothetical protein [Planctomycetota bacterium]